jgi:uncharacterized protein YndB with AHSA1/START domain
MVDILHRIGIADAAPDEVYRALSTIEGLAGWWTTDTTGSAEVGGRILFRFGPGDISMAVRELVPDKRVLWEPVDGPPEWLDTEVSFDLRAEDGYTIVLFEHRGWREPNEFMYHCSTKWASFLLSLKDLVETGSGSPSPDDLQISDWH